MKVWIVMQEVDHEGGTFMGAFSTERAAQRRCNTLGESRNDLWRHFEVLEAEIDNPVKPYWMA